MTNPATHDSNTDTRVVFDLTSDDTLVGESGGLSAIYNVQESSLVEGMYLVETEHGNLLIDPEQEVTVLIP